MSVFALSENIKKNHAITSALIARNKEYNGGQIRRGEVIYIHQTPARLASRFPKVVGSVQSRYNESQTLFVNVYNDHAETCSFHETSRIVFDGVGLEETRDGMHVRELKFNILDWDVLTGVIGAVRGILIAHQWTPLDRIGQVHQAQDKTASIMYVEYGGVTVHHV